MDKTNSKLLGSHSPSMLTVRSRSCIWPPRRAALSLLSQWSCCVCFVTFFTWISRQPPLRSWLYHKKGNSTQNSTVYRAYGNYCQLFTHESSAFFSVITPIETNACPDAKNARNRARNRPLPLRHVDFHLTHECLGQWAHPTHHPKRHPDPISHVVTAHMCGRTHGTSECSIPLGLRSMERRANNKSENSAKYL